MGGGRQAAGAQAARPSPAVQARLQALLGGRKEGEAAGGAAGHNGDLGHRVVLGHEGAHLRWEKGGRKLGQESGSKQACQQGRVVLGHEGTHLRWEKE